MLGREQLQHPVLPVVVSWYSSIEDLGSKTGCRRMFEEVGVRCPVGAEDLRTVDDIVAGVQSMRARRPSLRQAIVKLNEGVSGAGNAMVDLSDLPDPGTPDEAAVIRTA